MHVVRWHRKVQPRQPTKSPPNLDLLGFDAVLFFLSAISLPLGFDSTAGSSTLAERSDRTAERIKRVLDGDPGIGVLRHADAGYDLAIEQAGRTGLAATVPPGLR